jgi:hypothetical protein
MTGIAAFVKSSSAMFYLSIFALIKNNISKNKAGITISRQAQQQFRFHRMKFFFINALK